MEDKIKSRKKLLIIGGGAAGFFCAINAARLNPQLDVLIVEKTSKLLSKVKVSGGGRCNVTHACFEMDEMIRKYPRGAQFLKKAFHQFFYDGYHRMVFRKGGRVENRTGWTHVSRK
jgi:predicted flavoprotein YhiN